MKFFATGPNYSAVIPAAMSATDARRVACRNSGLAPWQIKIEAAKK